MNINNYIHSNLEIKKYESDYSVNLLSPPTEPRFFNDPLIKDWQNFIQNIDSIQSNNGVFSTIKTFSGVFPNPESSLTSLQPSQTYYFIVSPTAKLPIKIPTKNNFNKSILISSEIKSKLEELDLPNSFVSERLGLNEISYETIIDALKKDIENLKNDKKYEQKLYEANELLKYIYEAYNLNHPCSLLQDYEDESCDKIYNWSKTKKYNFNPTINLPSGISNNLTEITISDSSQYLARINIPINNLPNLEDNEEITFNFRIIDSDNTYQIYPISGYIKPINNVANISAILSLIPTTSG
jgi:hypothetical protein